jgi:hypothetical protein
VPHLKVSGKGGKSRYVPLHPAASGLIAEYLEAAGHGGAEASPPLPPVAPQPRSAIRPGDNAGRGVSDGAGVLGGAGIRDRGAFAARDGGDQCARSPGRHRQGAGVARACEYFDDADLLPSQDEAGR